MLTLPLLRKMLNRAGTELKANSKYLCELDSVAGDGDHGITIGRMADVMKEKTEDTTIDTHHCATVAETATVEQTFDTNNVAANILAVLFNNFITNPSKFTTKRVNFIATSSPKTEVVDYEHTYQIYLPSTYKIFLHCLFEF